MFQKGSNEERSILYWVWFWSHPTASSYNFCSVRNYSILLFIFALTPRISLYSWAAHKWESEAASERGTSNNNNHRTASGVSTTNWILHYLYLFSVAMLCFVFSYSQLPPSLQARSGKISTSSNNSQWCIIGGKGSEYSLYFGSFPLSPYPQLVSFLFNHHYHSNAHMYFITMGNGEDNRIWGMSILLRGER